MGNLPLFVPKKGTLQFGEYADLAGGRFSLKSFRPYDLSCEDLRPIMSREGGARGWPEAGGSGRESATILGLEMDQESEDIYSGLLKFHYFDGLENCSENLPVQTTSTVAELLPELITRFLPHEYQLDAVDGHHPSSVALLQGQMERALDKDERPLEIALDCSTKGLASPKFVFKSSLPASNNPPLTPRRASCFAGTSSNSRSVEENYSLDISQPEHYNSMTSLGSGVSLASSKSAKSKSNSSLTGRGRNGKKKVHQTLSNQELVIPSGPSPSTSPTHSRSNQAPDTPSTPGSTRKLSRSKAAVANFITRSLRGRRKSKQLSQPPIPATPPDDSPSNSQTQDLSNDEDENLEDDIPLTNSLISPRLPVERKFTLSTVMHIYYTEGKQAQVYKSVLVSEKATSSEVIAQALERYNMKGKEPQDFALFDVVGKWHDVTSTLTHHGYQTMGAAWKGANAVGASSSLQPNLNVLNASPLIQRRTSVEEFVVCYSRQLGPYESPYNAQFYLATQEGFTRRFELRSKLALVEPVKISHEKSHSVDIMERPDEATPTPGDVGERKTEEDEFGIFGKTTHRKRARRNRIGNQSMDSADPDLEITLFNSGSKSSSLLSSSSGNRLSGKEVELTRRRGLSGGGAVRENGCGQEQDLEIPIAMGTAHAPDFSALMCSSPDSGVEFHKHSSSHHNADSAKSSVSSEQSERDDHHIHSPIAQYPANVCSAFLLSLHLHDPGSEHLVHKLTSDITELGNCEKSTADSTTEQISLLSPDISATEGPLCCICRQPIAEGPRQTLRFRYILKVLNSHISVSLNGEHAPHDDVILRHGDIIKIGSTYHFMFSDYTTSRSSSNHVSPCFNWTLHPRTMEPVVRVESPSRPERISTSIETITDQEPARKNSRCDSEPQRKNSSTSTENRGQETGMENRGTGMESLGTGTETRGSRTESRGSGGAAKRKTSSPAGPLTTSARTNAHKKHTASERTKSRHMALGKTKSLPLPTDRKLVFSFKPSEEDALLSYVVSATQDGLGASRCKLATSYILAMCTEYCVMSSGPKSVRRFVQKATDRIQEVVWEFTRKVTSWEPNPRMLQKPLLQMKELFPLLEPVFFWLATTLEFYSYLTTHKASLHLSEESADSASGRGGEEDSPLATLFNILVYTYQQAFYPVSKVLYNSLPPMLESCVEEEGRGAGSPIVIGDAVEFLQALLDMMNDQHLHLEVVFQFYANIFFFINGAMFNALMDQGGDLGLYQYYSGTVLRSNLSLLEGWACQVGFKDSVLHYLAKFSGAVDLLATPTNKLLQLNWTDLCHEFPVLHPAQLHFLLSQYLLPSSITELPRHWTPSKEDAIHALSGKSVQESFDAHPGFKLPASGFTLDLNHPPAESEQFHEILESLRSSLNQKEGQSNGPVKIQAIQVSVQDGPNSPIKRRDLLNSEDITHSYTGRPRGNIGSNTESQEDLLAESSHRHNFRNLENNYFDSHSNNESHTHSIMDSFPYHQNGISDLAEGEKVGRVRTMDGARSFQTPEKLILEPAEEVRVHPSCVPDSHAGSAWIARFPRGSRTVTVPRGDKGFGFIMVEKKDAGNKESMIVVQQVLPGSTAAQCHQLRPGDQILAIDEQLLDGADYLIADKYVKEAEDDVTLTLAPRQST